MNNKYHITSDGSIFEMQPDGSLKKLGSVADGQLNPYSDTNKTSNKRGVLTVVYDGYWQLWDEQYKFFYNGKHISDFYFKKPFRYELPLEQEDNEIRVKRIIVNSCYRFKVDPTKNYLARLTYKRKPGVFCFVVYDEGNNKVFKSTFA